MLGRDGGKSRSRHTFPFVQHSEAFCITIFLGPKRLFLSRETVLVRAGIARTSSSLVEPGVPVPSGELACVVVVESGLGKSPSGSSIDVDVGLVVVEVVGVNVAHRGRHRRRSALLRRGRRRLEGDGVGDLRHLFEIPA